MKRTDWFTDARFGMFIHFGLYSLCGRGEWVRSIEHMDEKEYLPYFDDFNPDIDLSDLPEDGALNEDNSSDNISNITENEFIEENEEGAAEKQASVEEYMQETEDDMIAVGDEDNSVPVYEDISAQSDSKESAENEEIPLYDEAKIARASGESKEETVNGVLFPDDKIPDLIYSSEKSGKKPKKHKKSDAMASYDDILENFARELGEEKENASEADNS